MPEATPVDKINLVEGFKAELIYSVPKIEQGSWVAMTIDNKSRMIVSDQYGALYRFPTPALGETLKDSAVEKIEIDSGSAQGLLWAFDALYVVQNTADMGGRGIYRLTDSNGDDKLDKKELITKFEDIGGEHGPHAIVKSPDGKSLYVVVGNQTPMPSFDKTRVPSVWGEDNLLKRPIGKGFMKGTFGPRGFIAKLDPDGSNFEIINTGYRNQYDVDFNEFGDMFTYDADMEWDMNLPWYRPTRINHAVSGAEWGWRNGGAKWPERWPDTLPATVDIGPGSPTGVSFGLGAKFPAKYQRAFFAADWSYGKLYAVHMEPSGASYKATFEEFMSAQPLPLTDLEVNPTDGALYIAIGGRRVQSGLYRVTYTGGESTDAIVAGELPELHKLRREIETYHEQKKGAVEFVWPHLGHEDRFIRYAARTALEHQPVGSWRNLAFSEENPVAKTQALIALARTGWESVGIEVIGSLDTIDKTKLTDAQLIDVLRAYALTYTRHDSEQLRLPRQGVTKFLEANMPFASMPANIDALEILVYLDSPKAASLGVNLLADTTSPTEQIALAKSLAHQSEGWEGDLRAKFFKWFTLAKGYKGGPSFDLFIADIKKNALANTPAAEQEALKEIIEAEPPSEPMFTFEPRSFQKNWTVEDFDDVLAVGLEGGRDFDNGRKMFGAATCYACHRFNQEGGALGPDLTSVAGKFSPRDLLVSIVDPSEQVSDQYGQMVFTMKDKSVVTGRIMNLAGDSVRVNTNMMDPNAITSIDRKRLESMEQSPISMMPMGLINTLSKDDTLDLLAYLLSRGNPKDPMFEQH